MAHQAATATGAVTSKAARPVQKLVAKKINASIDRRTYKKSEGDE